MPGIVDEKKFLTTENIFAIMASQQSKTHKERDKYMKKTDKKDGINVDIRSKESAYITVKTLAGQWTIYVDNSTGEHIIESWLE